MGTSSKVRADTCLPLEKLAGDIGQIPKFEKLIATIRSREISACVILQAQAQLKSIYRDDSDTIIGNCDATLFLGGKEASTLQSMSEMLGKETIDMLNTSETKGQGTSHGLSYQKLGRELMSRDELAVMDGSLCILQLRGVRPFLSKKYDITQHPNYRYLADADQVNAFDIVRTMRRRKPIVQPDEEFELVEVRWKTREKTKDKPANDKLRNAQKRSGAFTQIMGSGAKHMLKMAMPTHKLCLRMDFAPCLQYFTHEGVASFDLGFLEYPWFDIIIRIAASYRQKVGNNIHGAFGAKGRQKKQISISLNSVGFPFQWRQVKQMVSTNVSFR